MRLTRSGLGVCVLLCVLVSSYASPGSWIDAYQSDFKVRNFLLFASKDWTVAEIDVIGLYQ